MRIVHSRVTVTSTYFNRHGQYHPTYDNEFSKKADSLIKNIKNNGYYSTMITGSWRTNPIQGYGDSFDRVVFKNSVGSLELVKITDEVIDYIRQLPKEKSL